LRKVFVIYFLFAVSVAVAQKFGNRSKYEKRWGIFHPFAALKVRKIYKDCLPFYESMKKNNIPDGYVNGGKLDAFRHSYFMAAFSQKIKIKKLRKLGIAHEKGNYLDFLKGIKEEGEVPDSLSQVMDLHNNELGFEIGKANKNADLNTLKALVIEEIKKGKALYFRRSLNGQYLNCNDEIIVTESYPAKWFIPKCLIKTNE